MNQSARYPGAMKNETDHISSRAMQNLARIPFKSIPGSGGSGDGSVDSDPMPKRLKKFEVIELIGTGGMGKVYRGRHPDLDILVAIKTVSESHLQNSQSIRRFKREAQLATKLNHPNIVRVYDVDKDGGLYFIVSEFVDGSDLLQLLNTTPGKKLSISQALAIISQITKALVETERHKIVHRDIKPANILITKEGIPKLADLGIAKQVFSDDSQTTGNTITQRGLTMGTLGYMAPEQILDSKNVDIRADLFSLGATFYHMVTGQPPFGGDNYCKIVGNCLHGDTPNARAVSPDLPEELSQIIAKMMVKDRRDRYQTPKDLLLALEAVEMAKSAVSTQKDTTSSTGKPYSSTGSFSTCPRCRAEIPQDFKFCDQCGYKTQATCPKCSTALPPGSKFCSQCGFQIVDSDLTGSRHVIAPSTLNPRRSTSQSAAQPTGQGTIAQPPATQREERRHVAVLVAEISGLTQMLDKFDPEDVHETITRLFEGISRAVQKEGGYVDKYGGSKIMALFGAPVAHEDDAIRACRAALAMQDYFDSFDQKCLPLENTPPVHLQVAINFGLVFVGGIGVEFHKEYAALGKTVELAQCMVAHTPPTGILISKSVMKLVKHDFVFGPVQCITTNKTTAAIDAYPLLYEINRLTLWSVDQYSAPFVGRGDELRHLTNLIQHSKTNKRWIEICGDQGVGKTRIVREASHRTKTMKVIPILVTSNINTELFGLIKLLVRTIFYEISGKGLLPEKRTDFATILGKLGENLNAYADALWYLSAPQSLAVRAPDPDPKILRGIIDQGVTFLIQLFAKSNPNALLFIDGYDLADEASTELIERQGLLPIGWPISVIVTVRYGRQIPLPDQVTIQLSPLSQKFSIKLFDHLVHGARVPDALRMDIVNRAVGIPFHIEEMVQTLVDNGILFPSTSTSRWSYKPGHSPINLPPSLFSSMLSRLDRLTEPEQDLMRQCAVQGLEFTEEIAETVRRETKWQGPPVNDLLLNLKRRGLVGKNFMADFGTSSWRFQQPLLREACYQTLSVRNRRELHTSIADALTRIAGGTIEAAAESVAYHYEQAKRWRLAAEANLVVGKRASDMFLNDKALTFFQKSIKMVDKLNSDHENDIHTQILAAAATIQIFLRIGNYQEAEDIAITMQKVAVRDVDKAELYNLYGLICHSRGLTDKARSLFLSALDLTGCDRESKTVKRNILYNLAKICFREGSLETAKNFIMQYRAITTEEEDEKLSSIRVDILDGNIAQTEGRYPDAVKLFSNARQIADQAGSMSDLANALNSLGNTLRDVGDYDKAKKSFKHALTIWSKIGLTESIAGAHLNLGNLAMSQGNLTEARTEHQLSQKAFQMIGHIRGIALAQINLAIAAIEEDNGKRAVRLARAAVKALEDAHYAVLRGQALVILAEGYLASDRPKAAAKIFNEVIENYGIETHLLAVAGALRGLGRVDISLGNFHDAITKLDTAVVYFEKLNREQETTRTQLYRGEALLRLGHCKEARSVLERTNKRFTAMGARRDSAHATRLLRELAG